MGGEDGTSSGISDSEEDTYSSDEEETSDEESSYGYDDEESTTEEESSYGCISADYKKSFEVSTEF